MIWQSDRPHDTTAPAACQAPDVRGAPGVPVFHASPGVIEAVRAALHELPTRAYALRRVNPDESDGPLLCDREGLPRLFMTRCEALVASWEYPYLHLRVVPAPERGDR